MSSLKQKSYKAFGWDIIGRIGNQGIGFVISIILARLLTPADFGLLAMVTVVIGISQIFSDVGLGSALIQRKDVTDEHYGSVFYFNVVVGLILAITLFFSSSYIALFYNRPEIKPLCQVMSLTFIVNSFGNVRRQWLYKNINYKIPTQAALIGMISGGSLGVLMAFKGFGVWSLVAQSLLSGIVTNIYLYFATKWKPRFVFSFKALKELWQYGFNMFLSSIIETLSNQVDKLIIGKLFSPASLGFYFRAKSLDTLVSNYTSGTLMSVMFPVLSNIQDDDTRFKNIIYRTFHLLNFATFFLLGIFLLCAKDIIVILFSAKWLPCVEYYQILVLGGFVFPFSSLLVNILSSRGNSKAFLRLEIIKKTPLLIVFIVGFWFGITGFLTGVVISSYLALICNIYFAAKEMNVKSSWFYAIIWKYISIWIILTAGLYIINQYFLIKHTIIHLFSFTIVFSGLYLLSCKIFKLEGFIIAINELKNIDIVQKIKNRF